MLIYHVAKKSCDLRVTFVNETCTNKQLFFFFPWKEERLRKDNINDRKHKVEEGVCLLLVKYDEV